MIQPSKISVTASDVTGQKRVSARDIPVDSTIGELLDGITPSLGLNRFDGQGLPLNVEVRLEREGRHLHRSERVGDILRPNDHLVVHPKIMAGRQGPINHRDLARKYQLPHQGSIFVRDFRPLFL